MNPINYYQEQCQNGLILLDEEQLVALNHLQKIHQQLIEEHKKRGRLLAYFRQAHLVKGLYLWGGVGVGKTFLMDCFYQTLPFTEKMRMHFHAFMQLIHNELTKHQGKKNPLQMIAKKIAQKTIVICFDEFFVTDITDAMLLSRLLRALFAQGVCLIATSNVAPDDLYKNGLQRALFLPTIALLKTHTIVQHIPITIDYRLRHLKHAGVFYTPDDELAEEEMQKNFTLLAGTQTIYYDPILIHGRRIAINKRTNEIVWFDFDKLCHVPRSQKDYLSIATLFHTIFISHIPVIAPLARDKISIFIRLIDVLYDAKVRLIFSSAVNIQDIYREGPQAFEYARTCSRLIEMQSAEYFEQIKNK